MKVHRSPAFKKLLFVALASAAGLVAFADSPPASTVTSGGVAPEIISQLAARLIADAIPREYERFQDWGRTKNITTGLRSSGNFFDFDIHRRKTVVNHGVWKKYRVTLVEPEKYLAVRIENLRTTAPGRVALTLFVTARLHGWARAKIYDRGIHLIALEAEGDSAIRLWLDTEIAIESVPTNSYLPGIALRPHVSHARLALDDFRLTRISDLRGSVAHELGDALRHVVEDELSGPKLVAKLNRSIEKRRDRLEFTAEMLLDRVVDNQ
jgi:hypothetical protein